MTPSTRRITDGFAVENASIAARDRSVCSSAASSQSSPRATAASSRARDVSPWTSSMREMPMVAAASRWWT